MKVRISINHNHTKKITTKSIIAIKTAHISTSADVHESSLFPWVFFVRGLVGGTTTAWVDNRHLHPNHSVCLLVCLLYRRLSFNLITTKAKQTKIPFSDTQCLFFFIIFIQIDSFWLASTRLPHILFYTYIHVIFMTSCVYI